MDPYVFGGALWGTLYSSAHAVTSCVDDDLPRLCTALCCMLRALRTCLPCEACRATYDAHMATCAAAQGHDGVYTRPSTLLRAERAARAAGRSRHTPASAYPALHCIVHVDSAVRRKLGTGSNGGTLRVARRVTALDGGYGSGHDVVFLLALMAQHAQNGAQACVQTSRAVATAKFARAAGVLLSTVPKYADAAHALCGAFPARLDAATAESARAVYGLVCRVWCALHAVVAAGTTTGRLPSPMQDLAQRVRLTRGKMHA